MSHKSKSHHKNELNARRRQERLLCLVERPTKARDEVYVSQYKVKKDCPKKYHVKWCDAVNGMWLSGSNSVIVMSLSEAMAHQFLPCQLCERPESDLKSADLHMDAIVGHFYI